MNLKILITGGTSGLGLALARKVKREGAQVAVVARGEGRLRALAKEGIIAIQGDLARKEDIHPVAAEAVARLGGLDVLVNNASTLGPVPLRILLDTECEDLSQVLETNLVGPFRLTRALLPGLVLRGRGLVVNVSSDAAVVAYEGWGAYGASKAALDHLTRIWDAELRSKGVRFLAVDPGEMDTPMHAAAIPGADPASLRKPEEVADRLFLAIQESLADPKGAEPVRRIL